MRNNRIWPNVVQHPTTSYTNTKEKQTKIVPVKDFWGSQNTVLVRAEPRVASGCVCCQSFCNFLPETALAPGWPELNLWHWQSDSHKSMVSIVRPLIGLCHCHAKVCFFYQCKCFNIEMSFFSCFWFVTLSHVTNLYPFASLFWGIFPYFTYTNTIIAYFSDYLYSRKFIDIWNNKKPQIVKF